MSLCFAPATFCSACQYLYLVHLLPANLSPYSTWFTLHIYTSVQLFITETFSINAHVLLFTPVLPACPCQFCLCVYCFGFCLLVSEFFVIKSFSTYHHAAC
ncbi:hypothetical protein ILYODFUR_020536 [Ilyodon furcidens]|uniref:Uncharacterized protein n=1 Tax=Ilyodon furcidens TaxID=33524 RepID=A0ABV0SMX0_9TELE